MSGTTTAQPAQSRRGTSYVAAPMGASSYDVALARGRTLVDPALRAAVDRLDPVTRPVAQYHLGWCDEHGHPREGNAGKAIRPALAFLTAAATGGEATVATPAAVAVELVHNFSLVHDDLMDRDTTRRHRPTVWAVWGESTAILVGDAMLSLAHEVLGDPGTPYAAEASRVLAAATRELIRGQALDLAFEDRDPTAAPVSLADCFDMAAGKTGALLAISAELGALMAGAGEEARTAYRCFGAEVGMAFQLVDDLLGVWGWPERTGKPVFSDLRARKKTMPIVWALAEGGAAGRELADWLTGEHVGDDEDADLRHAADLLERAGARTWAIAEARRRVRTGLAALDRLRPAPEQREPFEDLAAFVVEREL